MVANAPHVLISKVRVNVARSMTARVSEAATFRVECTAEGTRPRMPAEWSTVFPLQAML